MGDNNSIQGNPTKTFFIEMITRDISIKDAILDLIDNSIDGANRINPSDYSGLFIDITINKDEFIIKDNCGGFSLETAQKYAFRFGRPDDAPKTENSVGRFGVGMKRALFKMGHNFEIETKTENDHFQISVDVNKWKQQKKNIVLSGDVTIVEEDWSFTYSNISAKTNNLTENGTYIRVVNFHKEVLSFFNDDAFFNELQNEIERLLNLSLEKGIRITLNKKSLDKKGIVLFNDQSSPYLYEGTIENVKVKIAAGLSNVGDPTSSGWYIYCNDRLVLEHDQEETTGWNSMGIPKFHVDFVMFKGVVFFDSAETKNLPLTTTKNGVDATSEVYKKALFYMREAMNYVLPFLRKVTKLGNDANDYRKLLGEQEDKISVKDLKTLTISNARVFQAPKLELESIAVKKDSVRIAFNAPTKLVEIAKGHSDTKSAKELGEYVFDYYIKMEELDNE